MRLRLLTVVALAAAAAAPAARADAPMRFRTVRLPGIDGSGTEPRIAVGPDDTRWVATSASRSTSRALVFRSVDEGQTWQKTPADPQQVEATIDVDVVAMHTGRILASELDEAGLNFPSSTTDDGGSTWVETVGATKLADQDRQWFAVGPDDPATGLPRVYLLYHNLGSGLAQHNMWVATSTDGGHTFGPPVPIATPGTDAYADLQCADSGGPSSIAVNPDTGRIYVTYTTRASHPAAGGPDLGGCAAQPIEFNIVNGTRVWEATSPDGAPGTWQNSLAVDDSPTGQVVSMQLAYGALDNRGGVWIAYPESPKPYPDLSGAAVKVVHQTPAADGSLVDGAWSAPITLVPAGGSGGANLVHLALGDPGKLAVAYYRGVNVAGQSKPIWYTHVSEVPTHRWTASEMMGICGTPSPVQGVENGLACDRSTDVWGIVLDRKCRVSIVWPTAGTRQDGATEGVPGSAPGTYVSSQDEGPDLCASDADFPGGTSVFGTGRLRGRAGGGGATGGCTDRIPPRSRVRGRIRATRRGLRVHGTSSDRGCTRTSRPPRAVRVAVGRRLSTRRCRYLRGDGRFGPPVRCTKTSYLPTRGRRSWSFAFRGRLPRGRYVLWVRGLDGAGNIERKAHRRNLRRFTVR
jgi:hypothetical protein